MSYNLHNFHPGHKLTANDLNEIDNQIQINDTNVLQLQAHMSGLNEYISNYVSNMNIQADNENVYLYNGDYLLGEIAFPDFDTSIVECTNISVDQNLVRLNVGYTSTIVPSTSPEDCTQKVVYASSNPSVLTVTSNGVVIPVQSGIGTVYARCGAYQVPIQFIIGEEAIIVGRRTNLARWRYNEPTPKVTYTDETSESSSYLSILLDSHIEIPPGYTVNVTIGNYLRIAHMCFLTPLPGGFIVTTDNGTTTISNATGVIMEKSAKSPTNDSFMTTYGIGEGQTYTNNTDQSCYLIASFELFEDKQDGGKRGVPCTDENIDEYTNNISIIVSPSEE